jgi:hypothetical protein
MDFVLQIFADKAIENSNNEIRFDNFIPQAKKNNVLTLIPNCQNENSGWFGKSTIDNRYLKDAYLALYDYLVKKEIIIKKVQTASLFTWSSVYTIDKSKISVNNLETSINKDNADFPNLLKCYNINYNALSRFLQDYKYSASDEVVLITKGGKRKKNNKKTKKRKTKKHNN